jgi:hypothetical protein
MLSAWRLASLLIVCALASPAGAQVKPEKLTLPVSQLSDLLTGLNALDGRDKVIREGALERVVKVEYELDAGVRLAIGRDIMALRQVMQVGQAENQKIRSGFIAAGRLKFSVDGQRVEGEGLAEFNEKAQAILDATADCDLYKLKASDLKLEKNPIPGTVIGSLQPILMDDK